MHLIWITNRGRKSLQMNMVSYCWRRSRAWGAINHDIEEICICICIARRIVVFSRAPPSDQYHIIPNINFKLGPLKMMLSGLNKPVDRRFYRSHWSLLDLGVMNILHRSKCRSNDFNFKLRVVRTQAFVTYLVHGLHSIQYLATIMCYQCQCAAFPFANSKLPAAWKSSPWPNVPSRVPARAPCVWDSELDFRLKKKIRLCSNFENWFWIKYLNMSECTAQNW